MPTTVACMGMQDFEFVNDGVVTATVSGMQGKATTLGLEQTKLALAVDGVAEEGAKLRREVSTH